MALSWFVMMDKELEEMVTRVAIPAGLPYTDVGDVPSKVTLIPSTVSLMYYHLCDSNTFTITTYTNSVLLISKLSFYNSQPLWRQLVSCLCPEKRHNALLRYLENLRSKMTILEWKSPPYFVSSLNTITPRFVLTEETLTNTICPT